MKTKLETKLKLVGNLRNNVITGHDFIKNYHSRNRYWNSHNRQRIYLLWTGKFDCSL